MKGYLYILKCSNESYYTGSTIDLENRIREHRNGEGANFTKKHLPVELIYFQEFQRIEEAFHREKQIQGWSRKKKEALIRGDNQKLPELSKNYTQYGSLEDSTLRQAQGTDTQQPFAEPVEANNTNAKINNTDLDVNRHG